MFARLEPPLQPSSDDARRQLEHELSKPKYGDRRTLLQKLMDWLNERLADLTDGAGSLPPLWLGLVLIMLAALIGLGLTRIRRRQGPERGSDHDVDEVISTELDADELRAAGDRALADDDTALAHVQYFRALARRGVDRTIVSARPGATAHEVANELSHAFPDRRADIDAAARTFDEVRYGGRVPPRPVVEAMRDLDASLARSRPAHPAVTR